MHYLSILSPLVLASLLAAPAHAETYGQTVQDESELPGQIKTVPRRAPVSGAPVAAPVAKAALAAGNEAKRIETEGSGLPGQIKTAQRAASAPGTTAATSATTAAAAPGVEVKPIDVERWRLNTGHLVRQDLTDWGNRSGWKVLWHLSRDWTIPADTEFDGDFKEAASAVIRTLAENGMVIRGQFYDGNRTLVVSGAGPVTLDPQ